MKFSNNHRPVFFIFCVTFCVTLSLLGAIQVFFGTVRFYNFHEEKYEQLSGNRVTTSFREESSVDLYDNKNTIAVYSAPQKNDTQKALNLALEPKTEKINIRVNSVIQEKKFPNNFDAKQYEKIENESFHSPVSIEVRPDTYMAPKGYKNTIFSVIEGVYFKDILWNFPIVIDTKRVSPRGQMSNQTITLSSQIKSLSEMAKVLVHELAHIIDIYVLKNKNFSSDPSGVFYAISWVEPTVIKSSLHTSSFVSGYAATNQYEDFAESFTMYVFHNKAFQERAGKNKQLQEKYLFLRNEVFHGFFENTSYEKDPIPSRVWDSTKIIIIENALVDIFTAIQIMLPAFLA